jgi:DNA polymerase III epsilon subunit-like protein
MDTAIPWTKARLVVADVEGDGQRPPGLVELALVAIDAGAVGEPASWLIRPAGSITWQATRVHGITNHDVADRPRIAEIAADIRTRLDGVVLVAHNAPVDVGVLCRELPGWEPAAVIDTLRLARQRHPDQPSHKLGALVAAFDLAEGLPPDLTPHRATYDALVTARLLVHLANRADGPRLLSELITPAADPPPDPLF